MPLCMKRYYTLAEDGLHLKIEISNITNRSVELGDIAFPFKWREGFNAAPSTIFESNFTHKHNIALNSSFQILSKPSGVGPFYIMMTSEGTPLEYFDTTNNVYTAYLHSECTGPKTEGSWRIPHTTRVLTPREKVNYSFYSLPFPDMRTYVTPFIQMDYWMFVPPPDILFPVIYL